MTNLNTKSNRSITPTNIKINKIDGGGAGSREFLNRSINTKNHVASNASFSSGFGIGMKKGQGSISKSPSNFNNKKISITKVNNNDKDKSFDINVNKSFDKSKEFNPKMTFKINSKSPVSTSRTNVKKPNFGSISTNSSPIYRNSKININLSKSPNQGSDNPMIKQYNEKKEKSSYPIYPNFIKKKPNINIGIKKITPQNNNNFNNNYNNLINNSISFNNNNKNIEKKNSGNMNMNSIDVSTNNTNGLNSNNYNNNNYNNNLRNNVNVNENDYFHQIQPKYEEEFNKNKQMNSNNINNLNNNLNNNNKPTRENIFNNNSNNNSQNVDFKQMNTSPLLRVFIYLNNSFYIDFFYISNPLKINI